MKVKIYIYIYYRSKYKIIKNNNFNILVKSDE